MKKNYLFIYMICLSITFFRFGFSGVGEEPNSKDKNDAGTTAKISDATDYAQYTTKTTTQLSDEVSYLSNTIEEQGIQVNNLAELKSKLNASQMQQFSADNPEQFSMQLFYTLQNESIETFNAIAAPNRPRAPARPPVPALNRGGRQPLSRTPQQVQAEPAPVINQGVQQPAINPAINQAINQVVQQPGFNQAINQGVQQPGFNPAINQGGQQPAINPGGQQIGGKSQEAPGRQGKEAPALEGIPDAVLNIMDTVAPILPPSVQGVIGTVKNIWTNVGPIARQFCTASMSFAKALGAPDSVTSVMGNVSQLIFGIGSATEVTSSTGTTILKGFAGISNKTKTLVTAIRGKLGEKIANPNGAVPASGQGGQTGQVVPAVPASGQDGQVAPVNQVVPGEQVIQ